MPLHIVAAMTLATCLFIPPMTSRRLAELFITADGDLTSSVRSTMNKEPASQALLRCFA